MENIFTYGIYALTICAILFMLNTIVISPLIIYYYFRKKKEPGIIMSWLLRKTNDPTMLLVSIMAWAGIYIYFKYVRNKRVSNG